MVSREDEPFWTSSIGNGRPGWHIEDTAISITVFGPKYDIHGGAIELIFPHHEAIKAQIEAVTKAPACKYWLHTGLLYIKGRKMSKSLHNFITIRETLKRYDPRALRLYFSQTHYRKPLHFKQRDLERASRLFNRLSNRLDELKKAVKHCNEQGSTRYLEALASRFKHDSVKAMDNDFDTETAVRHITDFSRSLVRASSLEKCSRSALSNALQTLEEACTILGIL